MKRFITFLSAILTFTGMYAQIRVDVPGVVGISEQFNITFTLSEKPSGFNWSPGDNFQLVWGPQTGSSTSITMVNGKTTRNSQYTYTYVLIPKAVGAFSLPAAHATVNGNEVTSSSPRVEVVGDGASGQGAGTATGGSSGNESQADIDRTSPRASNSNPEQDLFMRFTLSRTSVVVGEPITATLKLYTRASIAGFEDAKFPTFNGFWSQETEAPQNIEFRRENVGDRIYNAAVLRKWVIIPQKSGSITIDPAELVCLVQQRVSSGGNSIFDGFFDDYQTFRKRITTESYKVNVTPLPANAPASFTGAVGSFTMNARLNTDSMKVHDAASLTVTVSGRGNVALVGAPKIPFPPDSEVYDTKTTEKIDKGNGGTAGSKVFEYPFIPRSHGDFSIPPVEFTYFDISSRKYVTLTSGPLDYHVEQGETSDYISPDGVSIPVSSRKDVRNLSEDIHYIRTRLPAFSQGDAFLVGTTLFWCILAAMALTAIISCLFIYKFRKERSDIALVRTRGASKAARKRLSMAGGYLEKRLFAAFYEELHKALLGYAADKLNIGAANLSKEGIASAFKEAGTPEQLVTEYTELLDSCEFARYSPDSGSGAMQESYDKAVDVISSLDMNMKKNRSNKAAAVVLLAVSLSGGVALKAENTDYVDSLWNAGVTSFAAGDYETAASAFTAIENVGLSSPELYTNIADSYFKQKNIAGAILYYERALKADPADKDAGYNLEIARQFVQDRIDSVPEFFLYTWSRNICYSLSSNVWAVIFLSLSGLFFAMAAVFILSRRNVWRRIGFFVALAAFILAIPSAVNATWQKREFEYRDSAVVFRPVCSAKSAPSGNNDLFVLHEGTKVRVLDTVGDWTNIALSDGREGWVMTKDIVII